MRGKKKSVRAKRLNPAKKAATQRQGATAGFQAPKRVLNNIMSAMKSLEKAHNFLGATSSGTRKGKKKGKIGRPKKVTGEQSTPA